MILRSGDTGDSRSDAGRAAQTGNAVLVVERLVGGSRASSASQDNAGPAPAQTTVAQAGIASRSRRPARHRAVAVAGRRCRAALAAEVASFVCQPLFLAIVAQWRCRHVRRCRRQLLVIVLHHHHHHHSFICFTTLNNKIVEHCAQ